MDLYVFNLIIKDLIQNNNNKRSKKKGKNLLLQSFLNRHQLPLCCCVTPTPHNQILWQHNETAKLPTAMDHAADNFSSSASSDTNLNTPRMCYSISPPSSSSSSSSSSAVHRALQLIQSDDTDLKLEAAKEIRRLTKSSQRCRRQLAQAVVPLVQMLRAADESDSYYGSALLALLNLAVKDEKYVQISGPFGVLINLWFFSLRKIAIKSMNALLKVWIFYSLFNFEFVEIYGLLWSLIAFSFFNCFFIF